MLQIPGFCRNLTYIVLALNFLDTSGYSSAPRSIVKEMEASGRLLIGDDQAQNDNPNFKSFIEGELSIIEQTKVGQLLLKQMNEFMAKSGRHLRIVPVDYQAELSYDPDLIPQSRCDLFDAKKSEVKVHLFDLTDKSTSALQQKMCYVGFAINETFNGIKKIDNDPYHFTVFHELNHARIILKFDEKNQQGLNYELLIDGEIDDQHRGSLGNVIIDTRDNSQKMRIFGFSNTAMEEFQNIGYTVINKVAYEDPICENTYRYECSLKNKSINFRYPYVAAKESEKISWAFSENDAYQNVLNHIVALYQKLP